MDTLAELVDVVNEKDEIIGQELRSDNFKKGFIARVAAVFLVDSDGKFIITKRAEHKKIDAGLYDLAAVGSVLAGETYEEAAKRELQEELSLSGDLKFLNKSYQELKNKEGLLKFFCSVFIAKIDEIPKLNDEVSEFKKMSLDEIKKEIKNHPEEFCPGFLNDFKQVEEKLLNEIK